jgi:hypothetical protein
VLGAQQQQQQQQQQQLGQVGQQPSMPVAFVLAPPAASAVGLEVNVAPSVPAELQAAVVSELQRVRVTLATFSAKYRAAREALQARTGLRLPNTLGPTPIALRPPPQTAPIAAAAAARA